MKVVSFLLVVMPLKKSRCQTYSLTTNQQPILCALTDTETLQQNIYFNRNRKFIDSNFIVHFKSKKRFFSSLNLSSHLHHLRFLNDERLKFVERRVLIKNNINRHKSRRNGKTHKTSLQIK